MAEIDWDDIEDFPQGPTLPQMEFLRDLGLELGVDLLEEASDVVGWEVQDLRALSIDDASEVIEALKERRKGWRRDERY